MEKSKAKALSNIFALDLGTTKFCIGCLQQSQDPAKKGLFTIHSASAKAEGMRRGMLANMAEARQALSALVETAEAQFKCDINEVVVGVAGSHLSSRTVTISTDINNATITQDHIGQIFKRAEAQETHETREVLHIVPVGYRLDDRQSVENPVGFSGKTLLSDYFIIDADKYYLKDLVELCNESGLQVKRLYSEPFASASVTVPDEFKDIGCAMVDIGGGTTDGLVFQNNKPHKAFTINIGGKLMTNDLAVGLNLKQIDAEAIKIRFGLVPHKPDDLVECADISNMSRIYKPEHSLQILGPRIQELGAHIAQNLKSYRGNLGGGLILTGGGSEVRGMQDFFSSKMGIPVHKTKPSVASQHNFISATDQLSGTIVNYPTRQATMLGLLNLEIGKLQDDFSKQSTSWGSRYLGQFVNWVKELS